MCHSTMAAERIQRTCAGVMQLSPAYRIHPGGQTMVPAVQREPMTGFTTTALRAYHPMLRPVLIVLSTAFLGMQ